MVARATPAPAGTGSSRAGWPNPGGAASRPTAAAPTVRRGRRAREAPPAVEADAELVGALKGLRKSLAAARAVPAYVIFSDATLLAIAETRPRNPDALLAISGIGPKKLELYGGAVLDLVAAALRSPAE